MHSIFIWAPYPVESHQILDKKWYMLFPCLAFSFLGKSMGDQHTVLPDGQPPTVAFTVLAQLCDPKANETEMRAVLFTKNGEGRNFDFDFDSSGQLSFKVQLQ